MKKIFFLIIILISFFFIKNVKAISLISGCKTGSYEEVDKFVINHKESLTYRDNSSYFAYCIMENYSPDKEIENLEKIGHGCTFSEIKNFQKGEETKCEIFYEIYKRSDGSLHFYRTDLAYYTFGAYPQIINIFQTGNNEEININKSILIFLSLIFFCFLISTFLGW